MAFAPIEYIKPLSRQKREKLRRAVKKYCVEHRIIFEDVEGLINYLLPEVRINVELLISSEDINRRKETFKQKWSSDRAFREKLIPALNQIASKKVGELIAAGYSIHNPEFQRGLCRIIDDLSEDEVLNISKRLLIQKRGWAKPIGRPEDQALNHLLSETVRRLGYTRRPYAALYDILCLMTGMKIPTGYRLPEIHVLYMRIKRHRDKLQT